MVTARFGYSNIDRQPLGDMAETMLGVITSYESIDFLYRHRVDARSYTLDTREMKEILGGVSFCGAQRDALAVRVSQGERGGSVRRA